VSVPVTDTVFDAIVVGSGLTGGWAAKELTQRGLKTLVLERGEDLSPRQGPCVEPEDPSELERLYEDEYFIQRKNYIFSEQTRHLFNNDKRYPYSRNALRPFNWFRLNVLGGKSVLWGGGAYRWSDLDFRANAADGHGVDWPIRYADLEKWYSYVERFIGVSGRREDYPGLEDGELLPPMAFTEVERAFRAAVHANFDDRILTIGRTAVITENHGGRAAYESFPANTPVFLTDALFSSRSSTLPAARKTGNLTIRTDAIVERLPYDQGRRRVVGVELMDEKSGRRELIGAKLVFMCASTIATTQILLQSKCAAFPNGLANSSGVLGRYLMDHFGLVCASGVRADIAFRGHRNHNINRPTIAHIPRFRNIGGRDACGFVRGYGFIGWEGPVENACAQGGMICGEQAKVEMRKAAAFTLMGFGECLPYADNRVELDQRNKDRFGQPLVKINFRFGANEEMMAQDMAKEACHMLGVGGFAAVRKFAVNLSTGGDTIHEMGTARMGHDPARSVLNGKNQCHDIANLFITDGACMTSSSNIHPSLTYMALTARACEYAAGLLKCAAL
jgi:choline dehydrogenase-like flavoprotein